METTSLALVVAALFAQIQDPGAKVPVTLTTSRTPDPSLDPFPRWGVGVRVNVWTGFGSVMNDIVGPSVYGSYRIDEQWAVSANLFRTDFDFEDPADNLFSRSSTPVADASIDMVILSASAEYHFLAPGGTFDLYLGAGLGLVLPGDGEAVKLPQIDIEVTGNSGVEIHFAVGGSIRIFKQLYGNVELRILQSFNSFDARDRQTGEEDSLDSWSAIGIAFGLEWKF